MRSVRIRTPARLHFGLFADGRGPRKFGGVGLAIDKPGFDIEMHCAETDHFQCDSDAAIIPRVSALMTKNRKDLPTIPVSIEIRQAIPPHMGFGSGTQLALALAEAYSLLCRTPKSPRELADLVGRGRRSGVGWHVYFEGGFVIDAGRSDASGISPPLTQFFGFPYDWRVVLFRLDLPAGLHGTEESKAFRDNVVIPDELTQRLCDLVLRRLAPAAARRQYDEFGEALYEYNRASGECFAAVQGGPYAHPQIERLVDDVRSVGCPAVGQSSWGPIVFAVCASDDEANRLAAEIGRRHPNSSFAVVKEFPFGRDLVDTGSTRLLVSVRSPSEAVEAVAGGVDILDLKEPARGPLGPIDPALISPIQCALLNDGELVSLLRTAHEDGPAFSLALGELREAERRTDIDELRDQSRMFKVGFAGERGSQDWHYRYLSLACSFGSLVTLLVPAAYADHEQANSPHWKEIVDRIVLRFPDGRRLLVDTFSKQTNFWDALGGKDGVRELFDVCKEQEIHLALAGSLKADDIDRLADEIGKLPNIIAVRGAACKDGIRTNPIDRSRVAELRRRIIAAELRLDRLGLGGSCG